MFHQCVITKNYKIAVFSLPYLSYLPGGWVLFHRVCHVSTVAQNRQTKHWLYRGLFALFLSYYGMVAMLASLQPHH